jgi:hypothetical protein
MTLFVQRFKIALALEVVIRHITDMSGSDSYLARDSETDRRYANTRRIADELLVRRVYVMHELRYWLVSGLGTAR